MLPEFNKSKKINLLKRKTKTKKIPHHIQKDIATFFIDNYDSNKNTDQLITTHRSYYPSVNRIVVIGDIHGDLESFIKTLINSHVIQFQNNKYIKLPPYKDRTNKFMYDYFHKIEWIGGDTYVVQLGDQIDRIRPSEWDENDVSVDEALNDEGSSLHIFFLVWYLNKIAIESGGRVLSIMGNHEFMNIDGDFRYVSHGEFDEYHKAFSEHYNLKNKSMLFKHPKNKLNNQNTPSGYDERCQAYCRGEMISNFFAVNYKLILQIGEWLFVHAGLTPSICKKNICKINNNISRYLMGSNKKDVVLEYRKLLNCDEDDSPVWNRDFGNTEPGTDENNLKFNNLLNLFNKKNKKYHKTYGIPEAKYLAIGHTPQFYNNAGINSVCNDKIWRCDVGMSRAFGCLNGNECRKPQYLEILKNKPILHN